jgi:peptidoglycan hydrolase-like protein with peptidoglycan-binding domain
MHFEVRGPLSRVQAAAAKIRGGAPKPVQPATKPTLKRGDTGEDVKQVQQFLNVVPSTDPGYGNFGPKTEEYVRRFQRASGLSDDGIVGPRTWERIIAGLSGNGGGNSRAISNARPTLSRGSTGEAVKTLQAFLNRVFPSYSRLAVDSTFGTGTEGVVREFQRRAGLRDTGVVDAETWKRLGF